MYLIQDSSDTKFAGLLTNGPLSEGIAEMFNSKSYFSGAGSPFGGSSTPAASPFGSGPAKPAGAPATAAATATPAASASARPVSSARPVPSVGAPATAANTSETARRLSVPTAGSGAAPVANNSNTSAADAARRNSLPAGNAMPPPPPPQPMSVPGSPPPSTPRRVTTFTTSVEKGELGIGLDLGKSKTGLGLVLRLKEFPADTINPASVCNPPIYAGDVIIAVNGISCSSLSETVKIIRAAAGALQLTFEREVA